MLKIHNDHLEASLSDALNVMAFISPMPPEDMAPPTGPALRTRIDFEGVTTGSLELVCPLAFGAMLAANLLGTEPEASDNNASGDALRELLNVTCGTMLRNSGATQRGAIEMGVPTQESFDISNWNTFIESDAVVVDADGCKLAIRMIDGI